MRNELQRYLDGELSKDALPPELAAEAERWDAVLDEAAELSGETAPPWLETAVMARLERPVPAFRRALDWLLRPATVQVRPAVALAAAALVALGVTLWPSAPDAPGVAATQASSDVVFVQFVYAGEATGSVGVAGDFNGWDSDRYRLTDPDGDGVWTGQFPVPAGVHKYMFVVDDEEWVTDPRAARYVDDGFGNRNAILSVSAGKAS